jgi:hypothetical protein
MNLRVELSGIIKKEWSDNWQTIKLVQEDGYKIDLVGRFKEASESFPNMEIQVGYYLSDNSCTKDQIVEGFLKKIFGSVDASFEANGYYYSSWTSGTDYDTNLKIGGHDLFQELCNEEGRFILIELNFKP